MKHSSKKLSQLITQLCISRGIDNIVISPGSRNAPLTIGFTSNAIAQEDGAEKDVEEVAKIKMPDLNANDLEAAKQQVRGTARSMGLTVVG